MHYVNPKALLAAPFSPKALCMRHYLCSHSLFPLSPPPPSIFRLMENTTEWTAPHPGRALIGASYARIQMPKDLVQWVCRDNFAVRSTDTMRAM